ncbi:MULTISPECIES: hypothetical protein [Pseudobacillus]|uniref:hypothetical protein n=1 Tax=Pseudobacillus TaxID=108525 RepID=UPI00387A5292
MCYRKEEQRREGETSGLIITGLPMQEKNKKRVLLAINDDVYSQILYRNLSAEFELYPDPIYHIKYLLEFIENQRPDIVIVQDQRFGLEATQPHDREIEWLRFIENVRRKYDDEVRFVFLCERKVGDPFLSELVARNVLDIFHNRNVDLQSLINQMKDNPRYSKVAYLVVKDSRKAFDEDKVYEPWEHEEPSKEQVEDFQSPLEEAGLEEQFELLKEEEEKQKEEKAPRPFKLPFGRKKEKESTESVIEEKKEAIKFPKPKLPSLPKFTFPKKERQEKQEEEHKQEELPVAEEQENIESKSEKKQRKSLITINRPAVSSPLIPPKLIAVGSIHPGAGSTFLIHNFSRNLSDLCVPVSVVDSFNEYEALYSLFAAESPPPDNWDSLHYVMSKGFKNISIPRWQFEEVTVFAQKGVEDKQLDIEMTKELLFAARQAPIVFVDISHNWDDPISKEALRICDELWCVTEPNPHYIHSIRSNHKHIYQVADRVGEDAIVVIGNRWAPGLDIERVPEIYTELPYFKENVKALNSGLPLYKMKPKLFSTAFAKLEDRIIFD